MVLVKRGNSEIINVLADNDVVVDEKKTKKALEKTKSSKKDGSDTPTKKTSEK